MPKCRICDHDNPTGVDRCQNCEAWLEQEVPAASTPASAESESPEDDFKARIIALMARGHTIAAIKLYREQTGSGLAEAKSAVEALAAGLSLDESPAAGSLAPNSLEGQIVALLRAGKKIEAIRLYRRMSGLGLKEAKDAIEAFALKYGINTKGAGCAGTILLTIVVISSVAFACGFAGCGQDRNIQPTVKAETSHEPPEPWMTKGAGWPQMVLTNEATFRGHTPLHGASGFLVSSRDGRVFAATAKHLIGMNGGVAPDVSLDDLDSVLQQWRMFPRTRAKTFVDIAGLGIRGLESKRCDWLVLKLKPNDGKLPAQSLPSQALHVRAAPVKVGERVYLLGCPYAEADCAQNVYKGTVTARVNDRFRYDLDPPVELRGFSGAPIVDEKGFLVGVMTVWFKQKTDSETNLEGGGEDASVIYSLIEKQ